MHLIRHIKQKPIARESGKPASRKACGTRSSARGLNATAEIDSP